MALTNIVKTLVLDVYDHDQTQTTIKAIALDKQTRYVKATLTHEGADYPVDESATVTLTVLRPDKVGTQVVGSVVDVDNADRTGTIKGVQAELTQTALAVKGKCLCQFRITDGEQILRTEIFAVNNGQALDADITDWAGDLDGHNLDEMAESIEALETSVGTLQTDVATVKEGFSSVIGNEFYNLLDGASFEVGSLSPSSGGEMTSPNRIRSAYIDVSNVRQIKMSPQTGYKWVVYYYHDIGSWAANTYGNYYSNASWKTTEVTINLIPGIKYVRVLIADASDSSSIKATDKNKVTALADYPLYNSQVESKKATNIFYAWLNGDEPVITPEHWDNGVVSASANTINGSATRIWSGVIEIPEINGTIELYADSGYKLAYYISDANFDRIATDFWITGASIPILSTYKYIIVSLSTTDNATIAPSDGEKCHISFVPAFSAIPTYFKTNIESAIATSRTNIFNSGINGDSFVFITDIHWHINQKHSPMLIKEVIRSNNINKIVCGGDLIGGGAKTAMIDLMSACVNAFKDVSRFYCLLGNHDLNKIGAGSSSDYFTRSNAYSIMQKESDFIMDYGNPCYYYFDNVTVKTRYICLDTGTEGTPLDAAQSEWLSETLGSMPSGYHALIFAHIIYQTKTNWFIGMQPSDLARTSFMNAVCDILDAFNANNSDKKVEAIFGGHVHIDCNFATTGGIPIVLTDCDARQTFTETSAGSGVANHAAGTINEQCFDIVTIDYSAKTIKCVRIGRGSDRTITY